MLDREEGEGKDRGETQTFVSPGTGAVLQTFFVRSALMTELLPTFG